MIPANVQLSGYPCNGYLLVLKPHEGLRDEIVGIKETFREKYKTAQPATAPHITLVRFQGLQLAEDRLKQRLETISVGMAPFKIDLKGYGSFPTHSIYINIETKNAIQALVKKLQNARPLMKLPEYDPHYIMDPHISIATKLLPWQYEQGWLEYSHQHFSGSFIANGMSLLRKKEGATKYQLAQHFGFMDSRVVTTQGDLFA